MRVIFESVLMLFAQNYKNQSMLDKTTACQSQLVFDTQCVRLSTGIRLADSFNSLLSAFCS